MNRKRIGERLTKMLRIPSPGRNSFVATLDDAEFAKSNPAQPLSLYAPTLDEPQPMRDNAMAQNNQSPLCDLIAEDSKNDTVVEPNVIESIASEIGRATTYTIGLISLSKKPIDMVDLTPFVDQLAIRTNRTTYCVRSNGPSNQVETHQVSPGNSESPQAIFESWNLSASRTGHSAQLLSGIKQIPALKNRYPLLVIDIGTCEQPWVEQLGRMCDSVYLILPTHGTLSPSQAATKAKHLLRALVPIRGSWIARAA